MSTTRNVAEADLFAAARARESDLPLLWRNALERERRGAVIGNDPLPERRAARALAAFIATGLVFVLLPGTFLGVWNLLSIADRKTSSSPQTAWIQAHGQAQLLGWVGTFILGISLYVLPKFLGRFLTRFRLVWTVWALWTSGVAWRWWVGVESRSWRVGFVGSAILELGAFGLSQYLLWMDRRDDGAQRKPFPGDLASWLGIAGFTSFGVALLLNLILVVQVAKHDLLPIFPPAADRTFLIIALWGFAIPVAWGYSSRFVTIFTGLDKPAQKAARWLALGVATIVGAALLHRFLVADALALCEALAAIWALRLFRPSVREPKRGGVYTSYPYFIRAAYAWLMVGAGLGVLADLAPSITGLGGASRHALTVGFLATLIFCVGPLILPAFLSGRQLWSPWWMGASLWTLSIGCLLRVSSEAVAYSSGGIGWKILPVSGFLELAAVGFFVVNLAVTLAQPLPAWFGESGVTGTMPVYFYVAGFPKTRRVLIQAGLRTVERAREIPRTLTLAEASLADHADLDNILTGLRIFFAKRQPRRTSRPGRAGEAHKV